MLTMNAPNCYALQCFACFACNAFSDALTQQLMFGFCHHRGHRAAVHQTLLDQSQALDDLVTTGRLRE